MQLAKWIPLANATSYAPIHATNIVPFTLDRSHTSGLVNHDWMIDWHKFRVRHCDWLVANVTKNWALATRNLELVARRRLSFFPLRIWNSKVNGLFLKENIKLPWTIVVKQSDNLTITILTRRHIVLKPFHLATKIFRLVASWLP